MSTPSRPAAPTRRAWLSLPRPLPLAALALLALAPATAGAQRRVPLEFTRQGLLVLEFAAGEGGSRKMGRDAADAVRDRLETLVNEREVEVLGGRATVQKLELHGIRQEQPPSAAELEYMMCQRPASRFAVRNGY